MEQEKLNHYKKALEQRLQEITGDLDNAIHDLKERQEHSEFVGLASIESAARNALRLQQREHNLVTKILHSLQRIREGSFDSCEDCGAIISEGRLSARPITTQCIECKQEKEEEENRVKK